MPKTSFQYKSDRAYWENTVWPYLLMTCGPPPDGVKWYGEQERMHIRSKEARRYVNLIVRYCGMAIFHPDSSVSHYSKEWKNKHALHMKNKFLRWCHEYCKTENQSA